MKKTTIVIIGILVLIILYGWATYNSLVTLSVNADTQWKQVETLYQRRFDLIPNVVEVSKGIMKQEQAVFTAIADARTRYAGAVTPNDRAQAASQVEGALARLLVITENYPELRSSESVQSVIVELEGSENRISVERMRFNDEIRNYNLKVMRFPSSIIASISGFDSRSYFEATPGSEVVPQVRY